MSNLQVPSMDVWLSEAKCHPNAFRCGMYLFHTGVVRQDAKAKVRYDAKDTQTVTGMFFSYDANKLEAIIQEAYTLPGIFMFVLGLMREHLPWVMILCVFLLAAIFGHTLLMRFNMLLVV